MLSEAYHCILDTNEAKLVSNGRLEKVRAEIHLEVADCDEVDVILQDENCAINNEIDRVVDLMVLSVKKYEYEFGTSHYKSLKAKQLLSRYKCLAGFSSNTTLAQIFQFKEAIITLEELIASHEELYSKANDNFQTNVFGDMNLVIHYDLYIDYKLLLICQIYS